MSERLDSGTLSYSLQQEKVEKGNYGSMLLSRFKLTNIKFGIGDTATDKDGRVIRCNLHELVPLTFVYMPCSSMKEELDERRINFNKLFHMTMKEDMDSNGVASATIGDMNVTPTRYDSNIRMRGGNQTSLDGDDIPILQ